MFRGGIGLGFSVGFGDVVEGARQIAEAVAPIPFEGVEPFAELGQGRRFEMIDPPLTLRLLADEAGETEDSQVFGDRGAAEVEERCQFGDGARFVAHRLEDLTACGVRDGSEDIGVHALEVMSGISDMSRISDISVR